MDNKFKLPPSNNDNNEKYKDIKDKYKHKKLSKENLADVTNSLIAKAQTDELKNMGVSEKTIQDLNKVVSDLNNCDSECMKNREINDSRDTLLLAIRILNGSPEYFDVSQKNYLITKLGKQGYVNHILDNANKNIDDFIKNQKKINQNVQELIKNLIFNYSYNVEYLESIDNTLKNSKNNLSDIDNKINKYSKSVNLDERSNYFLSKEISSLKNYNFYITILYFFVLLIYIFLTNYLSNFNFSSNIGANFSPTNIIYLFLLIFLLILPFILEKIITFSFSLYEKILQRMNIQKFPKSYNDIIMEDK